MEQGKSRLMIDFSDREKMMAFVKSMSDLMPHFRDNTPVIFFTDTFYFTKGGVAPVNSYVLRENGVTPEQ